MPTRSTWSRRLGEYDQVDDGETWQMVSIIDLRQGKVAKMTMWYAAPFDAPDWRAPFVPHHSRGILSLVRGKRDDVSVRKHRPFWPIRAECGSRIAVDFEAGNHREAGLLYPDIGPSGSAEQR